MFHQSTVVADPLMFFRLKSRFPRDSVFPRHEGLNVSGTLVLAHLLKLFVLQTYNIRRALMSILDISIAFSDTFVAFAGDTTLNTSRSSLNNSRRHRSKKQRRERRNIVSYAPISSIIADSSESESDADEPEVLQSFEGSKSVSLAESSGYDSFAEDDLMGRTEKMMKDLDALIRYVRREAERFATTYQTLGILAFSLQDWDL